MPRETFDQDQSVAEAPEFCGQLRQLIGKRPRAADRGEVRKDVTGMSAEAGQKESARDARIDSGPDVLSVWHIVVHVLPAIVPGLLRNRLQAFGGHHAALRLERSLCRR